MATKMKPDKATMDRIHNLQLAKRCFESVRSVILDEIDHRSRNKDDTSVLVKQLEKVLYKIEKVDLELYSLEECAKEIQESA